METLGYISIILTLAYVLYRAYLEKRAKTTGGSYSFLITIYLIGFTLGGKNTFESNLVIFMY